MLERGLAADGRLLRMSMAVSDRPGGIAALTKVLADAGCSIKDILHDRARTDTPISAVRVAVVVETSDLAHAEATIAALEAAGYEVDAPPLRPRRRSGGTATAEAALPPGRLP